MPDRFSLEKGPQIYRSRPETEGQQLPEVTEDSELEIEIKYIVDTIPNHIQKGIETGAYKFDVITQGYLRPLGEEGKGNKGKKIRLRELWNPEVGVVHRLTSKQTVRGIVRREHEIEKTDEQIFRALWDMTGSRIQKVRFYVPHKDSKGVERIIELDVFLGALNGLVLAEIEFDQDHEEEAERFRKQEVPLWFGEDVSENKEYKNSHMASHGLSDRKLGKLMLRVPGIAHILERRKKEAVGLLDLSHEASD